MDDWINNRQKLQQIEERIKVNIAIDVDTGCWNWQLSKDRNGYGYITVGGIPIKYRRVHKLSWAVFNRQLIPDNMVIRHKCDNAGCCNPTHLELGTVADNNHDMLKRFKPGNTKLSREDVLQIYKLHDSGYTCKQIMEVYNLSESTVRAIYLGKSWKVLFKEYYGKEYKKNAIYGRNK